MTQQLTFKDKHVVLEKVTKKPKKLTGTRFATVMGLNAWSTPFEIWCAVTRTYEKPFEDTIYTLAGKAIEPKVIAYLKDRLFMDIRTPEDVFGKDYFKKTFGDFFPDVQVFGGMWDALGDDFVVEIKTTKRAEDWEDDIPIYYKLQAALYAWMLNLDKVVVPVCFLAEKDYDDPEAFEPSYKNIKVYEFSMAEEFPNFSQDYVAPALKFWNEHVETGVSPDYDEKKDAEILKVLRTNNLAPEDDAVQSLLDELDVLKSELDQEDNKLQEKRDRLKTIEDQLKRYMIEQFRDGDKKVEINSGRFNLVLTKSIRSSLDSKALQKDKPDLYDSYIKETETYTLKNKALEA